MRKKFTMIRIEEIFKTEDAVILRIEGRLDREAFPAFRQMCEGYLKVGKKVQFNLSGLFHIGQDGLNFFRSIRDQVIFLELNEYLKMAIQNDHPQDFS